MRKLQWRKNGRSSKKSILAVGYKLKTKKNVILEAQKEKRKVHFATLMDICHLKNGELEPKHQKYKGRVVLQSKMLSSVKVRDGIDFITSNIINDIFSNFFLKKH